MLIQLIVLVHKTIGLGTTSGFTIQYLTIKPLYIITHLVLQIRNIVC